MGKGDKWRKTDFKNFFENFDKINFQQKKKKEIKSAKKVGRTTYKY